MASFAGCCGGAAALRARAPARQRPRLPPAPGRVAPLPLPLLQDAGSAGCRATRTPRCIQHQRRYALTGSGSSARCHIPRAAFRFAGAGEPSGDIAARSVPLLTPLCGWRGRMPLLPRLFFALPCALPADVRTGRRRSGGGRAAAALARWHLSGRQSISNRRRGGRCSGWNDALVFPTVRGCVCVAGTAGHFLLRLALLLFSLPSFLLDAFWAYAAIFIRALRTAPLRAAAFSLFCSGRARLCHYTTYAHALRCRRLPRHSAFIAVLFYNAGWFPAVCVIFRLGVFVVVGLVVRLVCLRRLPLLWHRALSSVLRCDIQTTSALTCTDKADWTRYVSPPDIMFLPSGV